MDGRATVPVRTAVTNLLVESVDVIPCAAELSPYRHRLEKRLLPTRRNL